jgi:hypothetical protein
LGHLSVPTLGTVTFDESGKATCVTGAEPVTPAADLPPEPRLRELLRMLDRVSVDYTRPAAFNPREMITVVNTLRAMEKKHALGVLREYSRVQSTMGYDGGSAAIIVMRFLFSVPAGELHHTTYLPFEDYKSEAFPAWPAVVIEGVPLYLFPLGGWGLGGALPPVDKYLDWYAEHGTLIGAPLRPTDNPIAVWDAWQNGLRKLIEAADPSHAAAADNLIITQLLRLIDTVHARQFDEDEGFCNGREELWAQALITLKTSPCRWDEKSARYVRADDGSFIEPTQETQYARVIWELQLEGRRSRLVLHRVSHSAIHVGIEQTAKHAPVLPNMILRLFAADDVEREIGSLDVDGSFTSGSQSSSTHVNLPMGVKLRAHLIQDNDIILETGILDVDREVKRAH